MIWLAMSAFWSSRIALLGYVKMQRARRLGLTGGIGSGKSTVAKILAQAGAAIIDADAISRSLTSAGGLAIAPIEQRLARSNRMRRARLTAPSCAT